MRNIIKRAAVLTVAMVVLSAQATDYPDPGGAGDFTGGNADLDIVSVGVNNDATTLTFTINLAGNPMNNDWYNYYVGISRNLFGGVGGNLNDSGGWGKDIQMSSGGMDFFIGSYPAFGGYDLLTWAPSSWSSTSGSASQTATSVTIPVALADLGVVPGDVLMFDVWASTSGGDTVLDALSDGTTRSWNSDPFDTGQNALTYTIVPEPGIGALMMLSALVLGSRVRRKP